MKKDKKYRVVHVTTEILDFFLGGIARVVTSLYENRQEDELFILNHQNSTNDFSLTKNEDILKIHIQDFLNLEKLPLQQQEEPDVVFFHSFNSLFDLKLKTNAKKIYVIHSIIPFENQFYSKPDVKSEERFWKAYDNADEMVMVSNSEVEKMKYLVQKMGKKMKPIYFVYNGIESFVDKKIYFPKNNMIGYVGRVDYRKGIIQLIEQMKNVVGYRLLMATGSSSSYNPIAYEKMISTIEHCAKGKAIPLGYLQGDRLNALYNQSECIVVPSLYEPFGMIILEAMRMGKVIIASKVDGIVEILGEDYPFYFDVCKDKDLCRVLDKFNQYDLIEKEKIVKKNYDILDCFSAETMVDGYRKLSLL